jgi:hypothetical protein
MIMRVAHGPACTFAVLSAVAFPAGAIVTGNVEVQSQTVRTLGDTGNGGSQGTTASLLQENVSVHYAGLPFGPAFALVTLGGGFSNINGAMGNGQTLHGRATSFDLSAAFLPRRAYPLRIFTRGSVVDGPPGIIASTGGAVSLAYGGSLNLESGKTLPGLRLDFEEDRSSHVADKPLSDVRRTAAATAFKSYGAELLNLSLRLDDDQRLGAGAFQTRSANLAWTSPQHQTLLAASEVRHTSVDLAGLTSDRDASASHVQRLSDALSANGSVRLAEATAPGADGTRGTAQTGFSLQPIAGEQLVLSASADGGYARTTSKTASARGTNFGGDTRIGYTRPIGGWTASAFVGGNIDHCNCEFGNSGTQEGLGGGLSVGKTTASRILLQGDYSAQRVFAPLSRGGRRLEQHVRGSTRLPVTQNADASFSLGYDDGYREVIDVAAGSAYTLRELAASGAAGLTYRLDRGYLSSELRHVRGDAIVPTSRFVAGAPAAARTMTSATMTGGYNPWSGLELTTQLAGSWTDLRGAPPLSSTAVTIGSVYRFGRMTFSASYQILHTNSSNLSSNQQSIRATFARPFEI